MKILFIVRRSALCALGISAFLGQSVTAQTLTRPETQVRATADSFYSAIAEGLWAAAAAMLDMKRFAAFVKF